MQGRSSAVSTGYIDPFKRMEEEASKFRRIALYIALILVFLSLIEVIFIRKYLKIVLSYREVGLLEAFIGGVALLAPLFLLALALVLFLAIKIYGQYIAQFNLVRYISGIKLKNLRELSDREYAMVSGEVISSSYEVPITGNWVLFCRGEIYKRRPAGTSYEKLALREYYLPKSVFKDGLRCRDELGNDFSIQLERSVDIFQELLRTDSAQKITLDTMESPKLGEKIASSPYRDVLSVKISPFGDMYETVYVEEIFVPSNYRNLLVIGEFYKNGNTYAVKLQPGKFFAKFSNLGISPVKALSKFMEPFKTELRKRRNTLRKVVITSVIIFLLTLTSQVIYFYFLGRN